LTIADDKEESKKNIIVMIKEKNVNEKETKK